MAFLKFLFIFIVCLYAFRLLFRLFFPLLMRKMAERMMRKGGGYQQFHKEFRFGEQKEQNHNTTKKGEIRVDYIPPKDDETSKRNPDAGEYVEFEEIK